MSWNKKPRKFERGNRIESLAEFQDVVEARNWIWFGGFRPGPIHSAAMACRQFRDVARLIEMGALFEARVTATYRAYEEREQEREPQDIAF